jgi:hypothetical protein
LNLIGWSLPVETACRLHSCWSGWILPWWLHQCMYAQGKSLEALLEKCSTLCLELICAYLDNDQGTGDIWDLRFSTSSLIFLITTSSRWNHRSLIENQGTGDIWDWRFSIWFFDCEFFDLRIFEGFPILLWNAKTPQNSQSNLQKCY